MKTRAAVSAGSYFPGVLSKCYPQKWELVMMETETYGKYTVYVEELINIKKKKKKPTGWVLSASEWASFKSVKIIKIYCRMKKMDIPFTMQITGG